MMASRDSTSVTASRDCMSPGGQCRFTGGAYTPLGIFMGLLARARCAGLTFVWDFGFVQSGETLATSCKGFVPASSMLLPVRSLRDRHDKRPPQSAGIPSKTHKSPRDLSLLAAASLGSPPAGAVAWLSCEGSKNSCCWEDLSTGVS